jgi:hypothetical protein
MRKLTFYIQEREDGGRRMGIDLDGDTVLGRFDPGHAESDPALVWYVDVRCKGELPPEPELARNWLLQQKDLFMKELNRLGEKLQVGLDFNPWPLQWKVEGAPRGVEITIVCSSLRRVPSRELGQHLEQLAEKFAETVNSLAAVEAAA